jgi:hypothetical protein
MALLILPSKLNFKYSFFCSVRGLHPTYMAAGAEVEGQVGKWPA